MAPEGSPRLAKLPYYARALAALARHAVRRAPLLRVLAGRTDEIRLVDGLRFVLTEPLDLLVLAENVLWDAYRTRSLDAPGRVVDVGAGFGDVAVMLSVRFPHCRVVACEPSPERFDLLRENARRNRVTALESHRVAVGTAASYTLPAPASVSPTLTRARAGAPAAAGGISVPGLPLAELVPGPVDLVKIDCEGAEPDVLASLDDARAGLVHRVALEYHNRAVPGEDRALAAVLERWGFACERRPDPFDADLGYLFATRVPSTGGRDST